MFFNVSGLEAFIDEQGFIPQIREILKNKQYKASETAETTSNDVNDISNETARDAAKDNTSSKETASDVVNAETVNDAAKDNISSEENASDDVKANDAETKNDASSDNTESADISESDSSDIENGMAEQVSKSKS